MSSSSFASWFPLFRCDENTMFLLWVTWGYDQHPMVSESLLRSKYFQRCERSPAFGPIWGHFKVPDWSPSLSPPQPPSPDKDVEPSVKKRRRRANWCEFVVEDLTGSLLGGRLGVTHYCGVQGPANTFGGLCTGYIWRLGLGRTQRGKSFCGRDLDEP